MDLLQNQALSVVFFPEKNVNHETLFSLFDFFRKKAAGNIQFNNTFPLGVPAPFPLISANIGGWQITVNGQRIDFLCNNMECFSLDKQKSFILAIFDSCFLNKINRLGLVSQFKCKDITLSRFLNPNWVKNRELNSLAYVNRINENDISLYDNIQILKNNNLEFPYICVRDLNTGKLPSCFDRGYLEKAIQIANEKFSLKSIGEELYGER
mgnify:CR=1 FL=1